jgi:hypothetical protein
MTATSQMNTTHPTELQGQPTMLDHTTIEQLRALKLEGFAAGLEEQMRQPNLHGLSFEERLARSSCSDETRFRLCDVHLR